MKKFFENPKMNISGFNTENIVTVSVVEAPAPAADNTDYGSAYKYIKEKVSADNAVVRITF